MLLLYLTKFTEIFRYHLSLFTVSSSWVGMSLCSCQVDVRTPARWRVVTLAVSPLRVAHRPGEETVTRLRASVTGPPGPASL